MSNRYWIRRNTIGNWNDDSNWSTTSGGSGGASYPNSGDTAIFDDSDVAASECNINVNITVDYLTLENNCRNIIYINNNLIINNDFTLLSGTMDFNGNARLLECFGKFYLGYDGNSFIESPESFFNLDVGTLRCHDDVYINKTISNLESDGKIYLLGSNKEFHHTQDGTIKNLYIDGSYSLINEGITPLSINNLFISGTFNLPEDINITNNLSIESSGVLSNPEHFVILYGGSLSLLDGTLETEALICNNTSLVPSTNYPKTVALGPLSLEIDNAYTFDQLEMYVSSNTELLFNGTINVTNDFILNSSNNSEISITIDQLNIDGDLYQYGFVDWSGAILFENGNHELFTEDTIGNVTVAENTTLSVDTGFIQNLYVYGTLEIENQINVIANLEVFGGGSVLGAEGSRIFTNNLYLYGEEDNMIDFIGTNFWYLSVTETGYADYTNVQNSNATDGVLINALTLRGNIDLGNNFHWNFGLPSVVITETQNGDAITGITLRCEINNFTSPNTIKVYIKKSGEINYKLIYEFESILENWILTIKLMCLPQAESFSWYVTVDSETPGYEFVQSFKNKFDTALPPAPTEGLRCKNDCGQIFLVQSRNVKPGNKEFGNTTLLPAITVCDVKPRLNLDIPGIEQKKTFKN